MSRKLRCGVQGCNRRVDTIVEGDNIATGASLPSGYSCDLPEHQWAVALAIMPSGTPGPSAAFGDQVQRDLAVWNEREARRKGGAS